MKTIFEINELCNDQTGLIQYLRTQNVLESEFQCENCNRDMRMVSDKARVNGFVMRCPECRKTLSIRSRSTIFDLRMTLSTLVYLVYFWVNDIGHKTASRMLGLDKKTITKHFSG